MSLIVFEGFDFGDRGQITSQSGNLDFNNTVTPFSYGMSIRCFVGSGSLTHSFTSAGTLIGGVARYVSGDPGNCELFTLSDGATIQVHIVLNSPNRQITVYRGSGTSNQLAQSSVNAVPGTGTWFYLEYKVVIDGAIGSVEVRCDNTVICNISGVDTQVTANPTANSIGMGLRVGWRIDDLYLLNGSGGTHNDFLGPQRVVEQYPISDDSLAFTPSTGVDNFAMVDDPSHDSDSTYNSLSGATGEDRFNVTGDIPSGTTVNGFAIRKTFRKTDFATCTARAVFVTSGAEQLGGSVNPGTTYTSSYDQWERDPTDSTDWTPSKINSMKIGYERLT